MKRSSRVPFIVSTAATALLALWILLLFDAGRPMYGKAFRTGPAEAAYLETRFDVAHPGNPVPRSVETAVEWLRRHQYSEGMWSARCFTQMCDGQVCLGRGLDEHDAGVTALAALAVLESGVERATVEDAAGRALRWLAARQDAEGCVGSRSGKYMVGHAIAVLAFARAYAVLGDPIYKHHAARGVRFLERARNPRRAWRYGIRDGQNDTSVTAWAGAALVACADADVEIDVDPAAFDGIAAWLDEVTGPRDGEVSYMRRGRRNAAVPGGNDGPNEGLAASAAWLRLRLGADRDEINLRRLVWTLPAVNAKTFRDDYTAWYAITRALAEAGDPELWECWSGPAARALVARQRRFNEGCRAGSWDPVDKWGGEGGRVYATAANLLTLSILNKRLIPDEP